MPGMIPWERYSGNEIEQVLAVCVCRLHRDATRIRPSQGDGGIDVYDVLADGSLVVYQIKKFASNLTSSQKAQIKDSWKRLIKWAESKNKVISEWRLVLPLDPTPQNEEWFQELADGSDVKAVWDGLSKIEGWIAQMPEIADYFLRDGRERVAVLLRDQLLSLGIPEETTKAGVGRRLEAIQRLLEAEDPNYHYSIHLLAKEDALGRELAIQPGLVFTQYVELPNGVAYRVDVFARYSEACTFAPIRGTFRIEPQSSCQHESLRDFLDYGIPFDNLPASFSVEGLSAMLPQPSAGMAFGELSVFPLDGCDAREINAVLVAADGWELRLHNTARSSGSKGSYGEFSDDSTLFVAEARLRKDKSLSWSLNCKLSRVNGKSCGVAYKALSFLHSALKGSLVTLVCGASTLLEMNFSPMEVPIEAAEAAMELAQAMDAVGQSIDCPIPFPEVKNLTDWQWGRLLMFGELAKGSTIGMRWDATTFEPTAPLQAKLDTPSILFLINPLSFELEGVTYDLGLVENYFVAGALTIDNESGRLIVKADSEISDVWLMKRPDNLALAIQNKNQLMYRKYDSGEWVALSNGVYLV